MSESGSETDRLFELSVDLLCIASLDGRFRRVNPAFSRVLGWSEAELLHTPFLDLVHADDLEATRGEIAALAEGTVTRSFQARFRSSHGEYRCLRWSGQAELSTGRLYAVARDVTEERRHRRRMQEVMDAAPTPLLMVDPRGQIVRTNPALDALFGYEEGALAGQPLSVLIPSGSRDRHQALCAGFFASPSRRLMGLGRDLAGVRRDGSRVDVEIGLNPFAAGEGGLALCAVVDLTERKQTERRIREQAAELEQANRKLEALATVDGLTGLKNRRSFSEQLELSVELALRAEHPLSLLMLDVDNFKSFNDTFGHQEGDRTLRSLSSILSMHARGSDFPARYGGEEFAVVLPGADARGAITGAERIRAAVESFPWPLRPVTVSIGAATLGPPYVRGEATALAEALVRSADQALYGSKKAGRNRVTHVDEMER